MQNSGQAFAFSRPMGNLEQQNLLNAPNLPTHTRLWPHQWLGLAFLFLIPLLAIAGIFGETQLARVQAGPGTEAWVSAPSRFRLGQSAPLLLEVKNTSAQPLPQLSVEISGYLDGFADKKFSPGFAAPYHVSLGSLGPGETARLAGEITAEKYGRQTGEIIVRSEGRELQRLPLSTFVFP